MKKLVFVIGLLLIRLPAFAQAPPLGINWNKPVRVSRSTPTLQVVVNPMLRKGSPIYEESFAALRVLDAEYVRYGAWYPYPRLSVAELEPPGEDTTYWDFRLLDTMLFDFLDATRGRTSILNYCTIPQWMFETPQPVRYPDDPNEIYFDYKGGNQLRDTSFKELGDYYARFFAWYTQGGFTDELGKYHESGHRLTIPYWEVLNEPELEHGTTPAQYTRRYDTIVNAIRKVSPKTKFIGMAAVTYWNPEFFEYFLDPRNHVPGTPLDMISYHFYAGADPEIGFENYQYTYFEKADAFLNCVRYIETIRKRLAPEVKTAINELGTFVSEEMRSQPIPESYWNLSASVYAYLFIELSKLGIDIIGQSQLVGYPGQFPDVSMMNWENGRPNARYWVLKLLIDHFAPGDSLVETTTGFMTPSAYVAQAFLTQTGKKVLFLNKRDKKLEIKVPSSLRGGVLHVVDGVSGEDGPRRVRIESDRLELGPFAVAVAEVPDGQ